MYVCIYMLVFTCVCPSVCIYAFMYVYICTRVCMNEYVYVCIIYFFYVSKSAFACMYVYMNAFFPYVSREQIMTQLSKHGCQHVCKVATLLLLCSQLKMN